MAFVADYEDYIICYQEKCLEYSSISAAYCLLQYSLLIGCLLFYVGSHEQKTKQNTINDHWLVFKKIISVQPEINLMHI